MKEWKVILATLVIFGAGVITGGLLVHQTTRPAGRPLPIFGTGQPQPGQFGQRIPPNEQRTEFLRHLTRQLELSPEQREKVERIIRESQQRTKTLWEPVAAKMNDELRKTDSRIREVLTAEQQQRFDEMRARLREARPEKMMNRPPGGGPTSGGMPPPGGNRPPQFRPQRPAPEGQGPLPPPEARPKSEAINPPVPPPDRQQ